MKLTDFVAEFLADQGITHIFGLTGGAVVHFFDSAARNPRLTPIFNHHEQAAAFAAEAYARVSNNLGAALVTTGPGGTNAITGTCAAWLDSVPCIYISGQARIEHTSRGKPVRQIGAQELDIVSLVSPITKYAVTVDDPAKIKYYLQKAVHLARSGRPGPVWVDIPLNFQWINLEPEELPDFTAPVAESANAVPENSIRPLASKCWELMQEAQRPLVLAGYGIRLAHAAAEFHRFVEALQVPFVTTYNAADLMPTNHHLYVGRPGISGQRGANLAVQNCDLLLCIGSHLCLTLTGTLFDAFARAAKIVMVDVDPVEINHRTVRVDLPIAADARQFLHEMAKVRRGHTVRDLVAWRKRCRGYQKYNRIPREWKKPQSRVNSYVFVDTLSDLLGSDDVVVVDGGGTVFYTSFQTLRIKQGQRFITSSGLAAMGSGLPESIGACLANGKKRTVCLCGDGSMQLNIQELQTIFHHHLPIKIFVFNNGGYLSIRHTQKGFLDERYIGSQPEGGMSLPDFRRVARAYGLKATRISNHRDLKRKIRQVLESPEPYVCEIMISGEQEVVPSQGFVARPDGTFRPRPLEDMYPYLDRAEFVKNMIVDPWDPHES